jgi:hypothetical protein
MTLEEGQRSIRDSINKLKEIAKAQKKKQEESGDEDSEEDNESAEEMDEDEYYDEEEDYGNDENLDITEIKETVLRIEKDMTEMKSMMKAVWNLPPVQAMRL